MSTNASYERGHRHICRYVGGSYFPIHRWKFVPVVSIPTSLAPIYPSISAVCRTFFFFLFFFCFASISVEDDARGFTKG
ncbi:hypothetical protein K504DRAFT_464052 [Pleomassaria siparia CBS 279.74]|uniref:Uncharacterized protein n=1 Tax=Pleomassaria siparia CBS 279.74 TaxID=1314801 RepID=A0A6G1KGJ9_9PLEO|nr:hypothetical protein K504DRAFT_464052 [Pleomassaria siparia CBS 279.74]